jgi:7,8-dihydropterin-6-yl-methyl-4-(beta-D-ribofuranosyl)aminobenzene 5'-phosphate synthase
MRTAKLGYSCFLYDDENHSKDYCMEESKRFSPELGFSILQKEETMANDIGYKLKEVDSVEVTTLMDNYVDVLLRNAPGVTRPPLAIGGTIPTDALLAEHGLSLLITVKRGKESHCILFDCGYTKIGVPHNMEILGVDQQQIEAITLSHGHMDHTGALYPIAKNLHQSIPLILHPDAFIAPRFFGLDDGRRLLFPQTLIREDIEKNTNLAIQVLKSPSLLTDSMILVTGEIERVTEFEKGLPNASMERNGKVEPDIIRDDQALVIKLREKGLVIISGCGHAGIINTVFYAEKITGINKIHAVIGGFHLSGPIFERIIEKTIIEFKKINPEIIVPMHCTGWNAITKFSEAFPSSFALNSVGTKFSFA